jgi:hypothetical protein
VFAGLGTLGGTGLDLRKYFSGSLAGIGMARRSCGRPAGGAHRAGEVRARIAAVPAADVSRPAWLAQVAQLADVRGRGMANATIIERLG